jgi:hypothetical protein
MVVAAGSSAFRVRRLAREVAFGVNAQRRFVTGDGLPQVRVSIPARQIAPGSAQIVLRHRREDPVKIASPHRSAAAKSRLNLINNKKNLAMFANALYFAIVFGREDGVAIGPLHQLHE